MDRDEDEPPVECVGHLNTVESDTEIFAGVLDLEGEKLLDAAESGARHGLQAGSQEIGAGGFAGRRVLAPLQRHARPDAVAPLGVHLVRDEDDPRGGRLASGPRGHLVHGRERIVLPGVPRILGLGDGDLPVIDFEIEVREQRRLDVPHGLLRTHLLGGEEMDLLDLSSRASDDADADDPRERLEQLLRAGDRPPRLLGAANPLGLCAHREPARGAAGGRLPSEARPHESGNRSGAMAAAPAGGRVRGR